MLPGQDIGLLIQRLGDGQARVHIDIHTDDLPAEVARLETLGAERAGRLHSWQLDARPRWPVFSVIPERPGAAQRQQRAALGLMIDVEPGRFEDMVVTALDGLPEDLGRLMRNVAVIVEHDPGPPGLLGLYEGIPLTDRTSDYAGVLPDRITIYRREICAICRTEEEVADQVRRTVVHEVAHHFGIDDDRLTELGW